MEEALFETALYREFVGLSSVERIPDRVSILRFRHLLEEHQLAERILASLCGRRSVEFAHLLDDLAHHSSILIHEFLEVSCILILEIGAC